MLLFHSSPHIQAPGGSRTWVSSYLTSPPDSGPALPTVFLNSGMEVSDNREVQRRGREKEAGSEYVCTISERRCHALCVALISPSQPGKMLAPAYRYSIGRSRYGLWPTCHRPTCGRSCSHDCRRNSSSGRVSLTCSAGVVPAC